MITSNRLDIVSVFDAIRLLGHDEDFAPRKECQPTGTLRGTIERMQVMRTRAENGETLEHPNDETLWGSDEQHEACRDYVDDERDALTEEKRLAKAEKAKTYIASQRQEIKNRSRIKSRQEARERDKEQQVTVRLRPAAIAKHPDVLDGSEGT